MTKAIIVTAVVLASIGAATTSASATSGSNSTGYVTNSTYCESKSQSLFLQSNVTLNAARFPQGAWIALNYVYWYVNDSGVRISQPFETGYMVVKVAARNPYVSVLTPMGVKRQLIQSAVMVQVWNGTSYEHMGSWDQPSAYDWYGPSGSYVGPTTYCKAI